MIYDLKTKNRSFLKMASVLKENKVKNNKFMLALYDESLSGIDPHRQDLTVAQKLAIFKECSINKWYYLREVVRIPVEGKEDGAKYKLHLGNLSISYLKVKNKNIYVILPRQHFKTTSVIIDDTWSMLFASYNSNIIYAHKEFRDSKANLKSFKDIKHGLPEWLVDFVSDTKNDKDNEEYKLIANRNNTLKAISSANSDDAADKLGRGMRTALIYFDEFAFLARNEIIYTAAYPAFSRASENAKKNGVPYGITITTTPNSLEPDHGKYAKAFMDDAVLWRLQCFDMTDDELDEYILKNSKNDFVLIQFTYKELGRDENWLTKQVRGMQNNMMKIKREILLDWPRSTDTSVFKEEQLDKVFAFVKPPMFPLFVNNYPIDFYERPDFNMNYIISCDIAGGLSHDSTAITLIAPDDFRIVGDFRNNKIDTFNTQQLIEALMTDYFRNAILIIERNSFGLNLVQYFMKQSKIEPRMIREERISLGEKTQKDGFTVKRKTKNLIYGVDTNVKTRKQMFDILPEIVDVEYDKFVSKKIYDDLASLERKDNGKIEHASDSHDDALMSYLIFRWSLHFGTCLRDRFKISAIPTDRNIKTISSASDIARIESIINGLNAMESNSFAGNPMYDNLKAQDKILNEEEDLKSNAFARICNLNNFDG